MWSLLGKIFKGKCILNAGILINMLYFTSDFISCAHLFVCFVHTVWFSVGVIEWLQSPTLNLLIFARTTRSTWPVATTTVTDCWPNVIWDVAAHPLKAVHTQLSVMCNSQKKNSSRAYFSASVDLIVFLQDHGQRILSRCVLANLPSSHI